MHSDSNSTLVDRLARYDELVEVGVGERHGVAAALAARGRRITVTDVHARDVPQSVRFVRDDVTAPDDGLYRGADAVYALNCPPELQRPLVDVARTAGAECLFTTLGGDPTVVDATPETLPGEPAWDAAAAEPTPGGSGPGESASGESGSRARTSGAPAPRGTVPGTTLFSVEP